MDNVADANPDDGRSGAVEGLEQSKVFVFRHDAGIKIAGGIPNGAVRLIPKLGMFDSSCPRLSRASTSYFASQIEDVDGRGKPGHDVERTSIKPRAGITVQSEFGDVMCLVPHRHQPTGERRR